jgi:hypothetical protein
MATEEANLTPSEIQTLKDLAQSVDSDTDLNQLSDATGVSRRDILKIGAALGVGTIAGGVSAKELVQEARAAADTSDSDGNVGLPGDRVDLFAEGADISGTATANQVGTSSDRFTGFAESLDAGKLSGTITPRSGESATSAISRAPTGGRVVFDPSQTYIEDDIRPSDVEIVGLTLQVPAGSDNHAILPDGGKVTLRNVTIDGNRPNTTTNKEGVFGLSGIVKVINCEIFNTGINGVNILGGGPSEFEVRDSEIYNTGRDGVAGADVTNPGDGEVINCVIYDTGNDQTGHGVRSFANNHIKGGVIRDGIGNGVTIKSGTSGTRIIDVDILRMDFNGVEGEIGATYTAIEVTSKLNGSNGLQAKDDASFYGCESIENDLRGLELGHQDNDTEDIVIEGGRYIDNGQSVNSPGIRATDTVLDMTITGVRSGNTGANATQTHGVETNNTCDYTLVDGCNLRDNTTAATSLVGANSKVGDVQP